MVLKLWFYLAKCYSQLPNVEVAYLRCGRKSHCKRLDALKMPAQTHSSEGHS